jgi:ABC-type lipoprotein release transport system permease subunit
MQSLAFRVCGIFRTTNGMLDERNAFVLYDDIFPATGLPQDAIHEAGILFRDLKASETLSPQAKALFPQMDVEDWTEMSPMLSMSLEWVNLISVIIIGIFLLALSFGIVNTMLMAVLERTHELGMLGAIGMSKKSIFSMIMLETLFLTFVGSFVGIILGVAFILPSVHNGLDLTPLMGNDFVDWGFGSVIYPELNIGTFVKIGCMVIAAGILSAIYPARKALVLKPLEAIRQL